MDILLPEIDIKKQERVVYSPHVRNRIQGNPEIMRITDEDDYTRVDFAYQAPAKYVHGGWVQLHRSMFIRPTGSNVHLGMIKAAGIPYAPVKHFFNRPGEVLYFTVWFPAVPAGTTLIDIIEADVHDGTYFNFYGVCLEYIKRSPVFIEN
jgi:hypothetical protein